MGRTLRVLAFLIVVLGFAVGGGSGYDGFVEPVSMFLADSTLYVSDPHSGIHLFDAPSGSAPVHRRIVCFPGNTGVAALGDVIYANTWEGIFALRVTTSGEVDTLAGPFPVREPEPYWNEGPSSWDWGFRGCGTFSPTASAPANSGGSSYAVFALIDTFLYYVDVWEGDVVTLSVSQAEAPRVLGETHVGWGLETLFPNGRYLFVGSGTGMHILDREPDPVFLTYRGQFTHGRACDPVVVQDSVAYVTLRGGTVCGLAEDELLAVNISNPTLPSLLCSASPPTPYGLAVKGGYIYVGNGGNGLSLYQAILPDSLSLLNRWGWAARDFIWSGSVLYVLTPSGVSAYDVTDPQHPLRL